MMNLSLLQFIKLKLKPRFDRHIFPLADDDAVREGFIQSFQVDGRIGITLQDA